MKSVVRSSATGAAATGASATGTSIMGSAALGALALGAFALGALAVGRLWIGKAQSGAADPANADAYVKAQVAAVETFRKAAEKARGDSAELKTRRGTILLEMADVQQLARQYREAANTLNQILTEKLIPARDEEVTQRQATALHLAGDYPASDAICTKFQTTFPKRAS